MLIPVKNMLEGLLDLAPIKDSEGRILVFKGHETIDLPARLLEHEVIQRVMNAGWLKVVKVEQAVKPPPPPAPPAEPPPAVPEAPVIKTEAPPEELGLPANLAKVETSVDEPLPPPVDPPAPAPLPPAPEPPKSKSKPNR